MKIFTLFLLTAFAGPALAQELPKKAPVTRYAGLWTNSPFTTKPPPPSAGPEVNPLEDYALGGVAQIPGGYRVTLFNRKNPEERIVLPDRTDFKVLAVNYKTGSPLGTTVRLSTGGKEGTVSFDEKLLTLKTAPANQPPGLPGANGQPLNPQQLLQQQQLQQQQLQQQLQQQQNNNNGGAAGEVPRQPRPRVVTQPQNTTLPGGNTAMPPGIPQNRQQVPGAPQNIRPNRR